MDELPRGDRRITLRERVHTIDYLDWLARQANQAAAWLADHDLETEADKAELAAVHLLAVVALLERPVRPEPPPRLWQLPDQGVSPSADGETPCTNPGCVF